MSGGPAAPGRIVAIDLVRGVAVLGILLLNVVGFAMPEAAYSNPRAYGGAAGADLAAYLVNFLLFDGRMRGLFSFLFGASMLIVAERAEARGDSAARVHAMRMIWLLLFGLAHLWLVWSGDILHHYALVGLFAFGLRHLEMSRMVILGTMLVVLAVALTALLPLSVWMLTEGAGGDAARQLAALQESFGVPSPEQIAHSLALYRSDYSTILAARFAETRSDPLTLLVFVGPETLGYMLFGMAALRSGLLTGSWSRAAYARGAAIGFAIGLPAYAALALWLVGEDFTLFAVALGVLTLPGLVRPAMIVGWACLILWIARDGGPLSRRIAAAGRMAFSNYLLISLIFTTLFYGYGLGWYGHVSRAGLYPLVAVAWAAMLLWSPLWLASFRYGPMEWLWRSLSRGHLQPLRGGAAR